MHIKNITEDRSCRAIKLTFKPCVRFFRFDDEKKNRVNLYESVLYFEVINSVTISVTCYAHYQWCLSTSYTHWYNDSWLKHYELPSVHTAMSRITFFNVSTLKPATWSFHYVNQSKCEPCSAWMSWANIFQSAWMCLYTHSHVYIIIMTTITEKNCKRKITGGIQLQLRCSISYVCVYLYESRYTYKKLASIFGLSLQMCNEFQWV